MPKPDVPLSLTHIAREPVQPATGPPPLLLLLHGRGSHEGDLMGLAPYVDGRFFIVSARGPVVLGPGMHAWYHVQLDPIRPVIDAGEADRSRVLLVRFIDEVVATYGVDPARVYLLGFSQGAIMSLSLALSVPERLAGVVAMSGWIPPEVPVGTAPPEAMRGLPILVLHGTQDPILPVHLGRAVRDRLASLPVALTYREYETGHYVSEESLADAAAWLRDRLDEPPRLRS